MLATHYANAKAAGLKVGLYYVVSSLESYIVQGEAFASLLAQYPTDLPPAADIELPGLTAEGVLSFLQAVQLAGHSPCIYTNCATWARLGNPAWSVDFPLWVASWGGKTPCIPPPWAAYYCWQYLVADAGTVIGVPGRLDQNVMR